jgi:hypothetical protein
MTEHYTHFDPLGLMEVPKIQAELLKPTKRETDKAIVEKPALKLVKHDNVQGTIPVRRVRAS